MRVPVSWRLWPGAALLLAVGLAATASSASAVPKRPRRAPPRAAAPAALIPRADLFAPSTIDDAKLSPDGAIFSYRPPHTADLILQDLVHPAASRRILLPAAPESYEWLYDNSVVATVRDSTGVRVLHIPAGHSGARDLSFSHCATVQLLTPSLTYPHIAPLLVAACDSHAAGVYLLDTATGQVTLRDPLNDFKAVYLDGDFVVRAASKPNAQGSHTLLAVSGNGDWEVIADYAEDENSAIGGLEGVVSMAADGSELFFVDADGSDTARLKAMRVRDGHWRIAYANPQCDVLWTGAVVDPHTGQPQAVEYLYGTTRHHFLDPGVQAIFEDIERQSGGDVGFVGRSVDGATWCVRSWSGGPARYYLYRPAPHTLTRIASDIPALDRAPLAPRRPFVVRARDGVMLPCALFLPSWADPDRDGVPTRPLPTLLYIHGGPWVGLTLNSWYANRNLQLLANRGYAVISCEFRSALGFGKRFLEAGNEQWGTGMQQDLLDIADVALARRIAAPGRVGLWGWSYGGYATLAGLAFHGERYACGLALYPVSNLEAQCLLPHFDGELWQRRVGNVHTPAGRALLRRESPLHAAATLTRPLLLTHGALDAIVPRAQSDTLAQVLRALGHPPIYLTYADEGHDYDHPASWRSFWAVGEAFLHDHLGGRAELAGHDLDAPPFVAAFGADYVARIPREQPAKTSPAR